MPEEFTQEEVNPFDFEALDEGNTQVEEPEETETQVEDKAETTDYQQEAEPDKAEEEKTEAEQLEKLSDLLAKYNLSSRWRGESDPELIDNILKSYTNLEQHKETLETENANYRNAYLQSILQEKQRQEQAQTEPQREPANDQERAELYVRKIADKLFQERIAPMQQNAEMQNVMTQTKAFVDSQAAQSPVFAEVLQSRQIGQKLAALNLPLTPSTVDYAYKQILIERPDLYARHQAALTGNPAAVPTDSNAAIVKDALEKRKNDMKRRAQVESGGRKSENMGESDIKEFSKWALSDEVTLEQVEREARKRFKVR